MPNPTRTDVHVNRPLTNLSIAFLQSRTNFIATRAFPNVPVNKKSDSYFEYPRGSFNKDEMRKRAPATESAGGGYDLITSTYSAEVYAFHKDVADQIRANADSPLQLDREATQYVTLKALIKREKIWATNFFQTGKWTTDLAGVAATPATGEVVQWDADNANGDPIGDVAEAKAVVLESTGFEPNTGVIGYPVWQQLKNHPDIIDRIKYSGGVGPNNPAIVTTEAVAALFELERLLIMKSIENTADEGQAAVHGFIGGKKALICYASPTPGLMMPSAGYTFSWRGYIGAAGPEGNVISRFRMDHLKADRVEIEMAWDQKLIAGDLGYFFNDIVS